MIYLVADSTACLTRQEARDLKSLMVPMYVSPDGRAMHTEGFVEDWHPGPSDSLVEYTTSQASAAAFGDLFQKLKAQDHQALCLTISSRLSGTYMNARQAALEAGDHVKVVDSRSTGGGMYLLLREARRMLNQGLSLQQTAEELKKTRGRLRTLFTLQDMEPLRRSGRLGVVRLSVSTLLNVRPVLALQDGAVVTHALARGRQVQMRQLMDGVEAAQDPIIVQHAGDEEAASSLTQRLTQQGRQVIQRRLGMVLAIHLGLPVLSTAWLVKE